MRAKAIRTALIGAVPWGAALVLAAVLGAALGSGGAASAARSTHALAKHPVTAHSGKARATAPATLQRLTPRLLASPVLYDQMTSPAAPGGVTSQDFEAANDTFDGAAADDFVVPATHLWVVDEVDVAGEYNTSVGPAASFNVFFYANNGSNLPGTLVEQRLASPFTNGASANVTFAPVSLTPGTYWVSVQARQDFATAGQWFWENRTAAVGNGAAWKNPGNGFGTGCTAFARKGPGAGTCLSTQSGPDQLFRLR